MADKSELPAAAPATADVVSAASEKQLETSAPAEPLEEKKQEPVTEEKKSEFEEKKAEEPPTDQLKGLSVSEKKTEEVTAAVASTPTPAPTGPSDASQPGPAPTSGEGPVWPDTPTDHPLTKLFDTFDELVKEAGHDEVYGIKLSKDSPFHTKLILQKFLRANANDVEKTKQQLLETLKWRKEFDPPKAAQETFDKDRFDGLGYILEVEGVPESSNPKDVVTFNVYGTVKDNKKTFGDLNGFLRWRVALMERSVQKLNLASATQPIPNYGDGPDPYQGFQVHDYLQVSFIRQDPLVKAASKKTIEVLGRYYPETLSRKFFVNVPVIMGWVYAAMKLVVAKETVKKFTVLSYGNQLAGELGQGIPNVYGGSAGELKDIGEGMKLEG